MTTTFTEVKRVLTREQATELVGDKVAPAEANVNKPTVFTNDGEPILAYLPVPNKTELRRAVMSISYNPPPAPAE